jgi:2'-5' RNA ligase
MTPMTETLRKSLTIAAATKLAKEYDDDGFTTAVESARAAGLQSIEVVTVESNGDVDILVQRPKGVMIAWKPQSWDREMYAIPGGEPADEIHLTVLYLGDIADYDVEKQRTIIGIVNEIAVDTSILRGKINGFGRFLGDGTEDEALWLGVDIPGLGALNELLRSKLDEAGIEYSTEHPEYHPHITVAYVPAEKETPSVVVAPKSLTVDQLTIYFGGLEYPVSLQWNEGLGYWDDDDYVPGIASAPNVYYPDLAKSVAKQAVVSEEQRYTYGPWYVPDSVDAHGEFATADTVQQALWKYVDAGNRDIMLQHNTLIKAGRWVELATVPFPLSVPVEGPEGMQKHTYPAGTPFMGVIWEEWAWDLIKSGDLRGFSVGGTASRLVADIDTHETDLDALVPTE